MNTQSVTVETTQDFDSNHNDQNMQNNTSDVVNEQPVVSNDSTKESYGYHWNTFTSSILSLSNNRTMKLEDLWVSSASLLNVSLAILAQIDFLSRSPASKSVKFCELVKGYESMKIKFEDGDKVKTTYISIKKMAEKIISLAEKYSSNDFVENTIGKNWKWSSYPFKVNKNGEKYDPYDFSKQEYSVKLKDARFALLVKTFRMYLIETVRRCFPNTKNPQKWDSLNAVYKAGGSERTTSLFVEFVNELLVLFDQVVKFSDTLDECKAITRNADFLQKKQSQEHFESKQQNKRLEKNYIAVSKEKEPATNLMSKADVASGVATTEILTNALAKQQKPTSYSKHYRRPSITHVSSTSQTINPKINFWKSSEKSLVFKLVDSGVVAASHLTEKSLQTENTEQQNLENNDEQRDQVEQDEQVVEANTTTKPRGRRRYNKNTNEQTETVIRVKRNNGNSNTQTSSENNNDGDGDQKMKKRVKFQKNRNVQQDNKNTSQYVDSQGNVVDVSGKEWKEKTTHRKNNKNTTSLSK